MRLRDALRDAIDNTSDRPFRVTVWTVLGILIGYIAYQLLYPFVAFARWVAPKRVKAMGDSLKQRHEDALREADPELAERFFGSAQPRDPTWFDDAR